MDALFCFFFSLTPLEEKNVFLQSRNEKLQNILAPCLPPTHPPTHAHHHLIPLRSTTASKVITAHEHLLLPL
jgi:hypothetical protein